MFKILSWNIRQGGGSRVAKIISSLLSENPDVIVLSEFQNNKSGTLIRSSLINAGFIHQGVGDSPTENSVLIASRHRCNITHCDLADDVYKSNVITAKFRAFEIFGVYLPHKKKHKLFDYLLQQAKNVLPAIIVGDYNTGVNNVDQKGNSFMYESEFLKLLENGFIDAFRQLHQDEKEYSWYSYHGNGFRYDHSLIDKDLVSILSECYYHHDWREGKISDHAAMSLVFKV